MADYRVIRTDYIVTVGGKPDPTYTIHRCLYTAPNPLPDRYGKQEAAPEGQTVEELRADLYRMLKALDKPILMEKKGKLQEVPK